MAVAPSLNRSAGGRIQHGTGIVKINNVNTYVITENNVIAESKFRFYKTIEVIETSSQYQEETTSFTSDSKQICSQQTFL